MMQEKRFCERCQENDEKVEATVQCDRCEQWLCDACYGVEVIYTPPPPCSNPDSPGFSDPGGGDKPCCDECMQDAAEREQAAKDEYSDDDMFERRQKARAK